MVSAILGRINVTQPVSETGVIAFLPFCPFCPCLSLFKVGTSWVTYLCWRCCGHCFVMFPQALIYVVLGLQEGPGTREGAGGPRGKARAVELDASLS